MNDDQVLQGSRSATGTMGQINLTSTLRQSSQIYYLAYILSPLLSAIFDSVEVYDVNGSLFLPLHLVDLLTRIEAAKPDVYNDFLEIIAFRAPKPRRLAIACMAYLWPRAVGHSVISSPFCPSELQKPNAPDLHIHQFTLWSFNSAPNRIYLNDLHDSCRSCSKCIVGFGLRCPLCLTSVHTDCYDFPDGNCEVQYSMADDSRLQRIGMYRFSYLQPNGDINQGIVVTQGHRFRPTNWLTLCLCCACRKPLWGCYRQGLKCEHCNRPMHFECLSSFEFHGNCSLLTTTSRDMTISWEVLRQSCLEHFPVIRATKEQLRDRSYEEISIYRDILRTQLQILTSGVLMGSVVVSGSSSTSIPEFELQLSINSCGQLLDSGLLRHGPLTEHYKDNVSNTKLGTSLLFDQTYLDYLTSSIRSPSPQSRGNSSTFLNVDNPYSDSDDSTRSVPHECARLSHMRHILSVDFAIQSNDASSLLIDHLHQHAFCDRKDHRLYPLKHTVEESDLEYIFPLPSGFDISLHAGNLISAIESCLADIDLATNEFGFLLLTRRIWPNGLASEQGLTWLARKVLTWILDEVRSPISVDIVI